MSVTTPANKHANGGPCACGCGHRASAKEAVYLRGHRPPEKPLLERVMDKTQVSGLNECWRWLGSKYRNGYAAISIKDRSHLAHRVTYELLVGPIPDGLQLDHVRSRGCLHRDCVNPAHLEPVTPAENLRRAEAIEKACASNRAHSDNAVTCPNGHYWSDGNLYRDPRGRKACRACRREKSLALYHRKKRGDQ